MDKLQPIELDGRNSDEKNAFYDTFCLYAVHDLRLRVSTGGRSADNRRCDTAYQRTNSHFSDVASDAWYAEAVVWCFDNNVMNGTSDTTFSPDAPLTRSMLATVLYRAAGEPSVTGSLSFPDTQAGQYYANAVVWANANNIMSGYGNGLFGTNDPVTREQLATILWRYDGAADTQSVGFPDASAISGYATFAAAWAVRKGIMELRTDGSFAPKESAARAEVAAALYQYLTDREDTTTVLTGRRFPGGTDRATMESWICQSRTGTTAWQRSIWHPGQMVTPPLLP